VNATRIFEYLRSELEHIVVFQIDFMSKLKVVFLFFPKRFKEIFFHQWHYFIIQIKGFFGQENSFVAAFVTHSVNRQRFYVRIE
jgi:hypothetical protein